MDPKSVDDLLIQDMNGQNQPEVVERPVESAPEVSPNPVDGTEQSVEVSKQQNEETTNSVETDNKSVIEASIPENPDNSPIDEYGNPLEKPKMYSEEEVQRMIRDRLSRGRYAEQNQTPPSQPNSQPETSDEEDWRTQLRKEIRHEMTQAQQEEQERVWRQEQSSRQAEFESKFTSGMTRYQDFQQVVADKPITDTMLLATRHLDNPAAFIYGAAKLHPQELNRISQIKDPFVQASEVGRLHERMVKERKTATTAPRPLEQPKGDVVQKNIGNQPSLEDRIHQYGKQKRR